MRSPIPPWSPVAKVIEERTGEILYTVRIQGDRFQPRVYAPGLYTIRSGRDRPEHVSFAGLEPAPADRAGQRRVTL